MSENETKAPVADRMAAARAARAAKKAQEPKPANAAMAPIAHAAPEPAAEAAAAPTTMEKAAITADASRARKVAALRAAKLAGADPATDPLVKVRVTKKGHGMVSMGEHVNGLGDLTYDHNEEPNFPRSIALELEDRGFVEIQ